MSATDIVAHAAGLAGGVGATLSCGLVAFVAGLALTPRAWVVSGVRGVAAGFLGAAVFVLLCWFGVASRTPVTQLLPGFLLATLAIALVRIRFMREALAAHAGRFTVRWLLLFVAYYALVYLFTMPPATDEYLSPAWTGNVDLLTYSRFTHYVMRPGTLRAVNGVDPNYNGFVYLQTPAVFYFLGALSMLFHADPLSATMPAAFGLSALLACLAAGIARSVFQVSRPAAAAIGAILLSGPFFRYVMGNYFLSTLMSAPVLLYVVSLTIVHRPTRLLEPSLAVRFLSAYVLLLFLYPFLFFVAVAAQIAVTAVMLAAEMLPAPLQERGWPVAWIGARRRLVNVGVPLALLAAVFFGRIEWSVEEVLMLSAPGAAGWEMGLISPWAVLGIPGAWLGLDRCTWCVAMDSYDAGVVARGLAAYVAIALLLFASYFWWFRTRMTAAQQTMVAVVAGAFLAYAGFYLLSGATYQQWKFASYTALPWSFVALAAVAHLLSGATLPAWAAAARLSREARIGLATAVVVLFVGGNLAAHSTADPPLVRFPASFRNLAALNRMPSFRDITVRMDETGDAFATLLAIYFMPDKNVHIISPRLARDDKLSWDQVSPERPLLLQNVGCEGIGHDDVLPVPEIGCLLYAPPSLALDRPYSFNQTYLFVELTGLGPREPSGRWNTGPSVTLTLTGDLKRVSLFQDSFVNLRVNPYLPPGASHQRLVLGWGHGRRAEVTLTGREVISLPISRGDWTGVRLWTLPIAIDLPDGVVPPYMYAPKQNAVDGPLAALFEELSVTSTPAGRVVAH